MSVESRLKALVKSESNKLEEARKKEPSHSALFSVEDLLRHESAHKALEYVRGEEDPQTKEILDLLELDSDVPHPY